MFLMLYIETPLIRGIKMQEGAGYGTIIRQEISELSARVALTIGDAARAFRLI